MIPIIINNIDNGWWRKCGKDVEFLSIAFFHPAILTLYCLTMMQIFVLWILSTEGSFHHIQEVVVVAVMALQQQQEQVQEQEIPKLGTGG